LLEREKYEIILNIENYCKRIVADDLIIEFEDLGDDLERQYEN